MSDCEGCELSEIQRVLLNQDIEILDKKNSQHRAEIRHLKAHMRHQRNLHETEMNKAREAYKGLLEKTK